jgi:hypothetical protein
MTSSSRGAYRARAMQDIAPENREGAGKAGCRPHPWSACNKKARGRTTGTSRTSGLPCATVLTLIRDLPGDRLDCPRRPRARRIADLASAPGCQDHTISRPHHVVRPRSQALRHAASIASHPACRDDRDTPLLPRRDGREHRRDLPDDASVQACDKVTRRALCAWVGCGEYSVLTTETIDHAQRKAAALPDAVVRISPTKLSSAGRSGRRKHIPAVWLLSGFRRDSRMRC